MSKAENDGEELFAARVGDRLVAARKAAGLSLEDIVLRTRIPRRHLEMIEAGNHSALPAITYSAGFVKTYAQLLGLDGAQLSRDFRTEVGQVEQVHHSPAPFEPADPARMPSRLLAFVALGIAVALAIAYLVWRGGTLTADERTSLAAGTMVEAEAPVMATTKPVAPPVATPPPSGAIALTAVQPVWLKVYEKDGPTLFMGEMAVGQRFEVPATAVDPQIWTGRPQAVQVTVGGKPVPPLGKADQTIRDVSLKRDALLAHPATANAPTPAKPALAPTPAAQVTPVDPTPAPAADPPPTTEPAPRP
jgi:transcriptional regulator with XRE-family HTH domain